MRVSPEPTLSLLRFRFKSLQHYIPRCILSIPPTPAVSDELVIDVSDIGQEHIGNRTLVLVLCVSLKRDFLPKDEGRGALLDALPIGLAFLRAVDTSKGRYVQGVGCAGL